MTEREDVVQLREEALRARTEAHAGVLERERLAEQIREANEQLVIASMRADAAAAEAETNARAKDEFLAMLGHELRNPLSPILSVLGLMQMLDPTVFERERGIIERQVRYLVRLVDDLLDVSRIGRGKIVLHREPLELADVVSRALEMVTSLVESKNHELRVDVAPSGLVVDADADRLAQVIANVLTNAAGYTPPGGSISVSGERRLSTITIRVRDTGVGISAEMLPRVFDLFVQERQGLDRPEGGLGVGLTIARTLVTLHGGTISATSAGLGHGTELVIELPASTQQRGDLDMTPEPAVTEPARALNILVVEDNHEIAELQAQLLTLLGHEVRIAFEGVSALSVVEHFIPDVALVDIGLPGMNGYEVVTRLREVLSGHDVRFIAVTGYGQAIDHRRSRDAGFDVHLVKPVAADKLKATIRGSMRARARG